MNNPLLTPVEVQKENEKIIRSLYQELTAGRTVTSLAGDVNASRPSSLKSLMHFFYTLGEAFPEFEINIEDLLMEGERVMVRYTISGIQSGYFLGTSPTFERMAIRVIDIFRLENGQVAEYWEAARQLNALP